MTEKEETEAQRVHRELADAMRDGTVTLEKLVDAAAPILAAISEGAAPVPPAEGRFIPEKNAAELVPLVGSAIADINFTPVEEQLPDMHPRYQELPPMGPVRLTAGTAQWDHLSAVARDAHLASLERPVSEQQIHTSGLVVAGEPKEVSSLERYIEGFAAGAGSRKDALFADPIFMRGYRDGAAARMKAFEEEQTRQRFGGER